MANNVSEKIHSKLIAEVANLSPDLYNMLLMSKNKAELKRMLDEVSEKMAYLDSLSGVETRPGDPMTSYSALADSRKSPYDKYLSLANADPKLNDPTTIKTVESAIAFHDKEKVKDLIGYAEANNENVNAFLAKGLDTRLSLVECYRYLEEAEKSLEAELQHTK